MGKNAAFVGGAYGLLAAAIAADPSQPVLTWYDDATGERVELSAATLDNWTAKTANLLVDGCGLGPDDPAEVHLPPHWQSAAVLFGCWRAGLAVHLSGGDVAFAAAPVDTSASDRFLLGLAPMGLPARGPLPAGWVDYVVEVRGYGDVFSGPPVRAGAELVEAAVSRGLRGRVLVDASAHPDPVDWLLAPLAGGGSVVLCANLDRAALAARVAAERVDTVL